jgi:ubiquinone/menaquinone biosynthesis C-methylase UbiE
MSDKKVLDACCGSRMFWFDKSDDRALFNDIRKESHTLCDGRGLEINPDTQYDFTNLGFKDNQFNLVVFDPPHLKNVGDEAYMAKKYGKLTGDWHEMLKEGFKECFRVLKPGGTLIFKWNEDQIKVKEILSLTEEKPLFGHRSGKASKTHWIAFIKNGDL